ncbi:hypothetical protein GS601_21150 [Myxacorys almedinensis A]|uniref:Uncharacterized protein n=1 Tax=Myxacorys almedinensis A TaxID=2690445 RepID=A0A8J7Z4R2_9CYAN|nr:hypothetical protein [Myxacorys almedinensis A]
MRAAQLGKDLRVVWELALRYARLLCCYRLRRAWQLNPPLKTIATNLAIVGTLFLAPV